MGWRVGKLQAAGGGAVLTLMVMARWGRSYQEPAPPQALKRQDVVVSADGSVLVPLATLVEGPFELEQEDPVLIQHIRTKLSPPASKGSVLKLAKPVHTGQIGQAAEVISYYKEKRGGVFVEAGAWDGEYLSNTLYLEANYSWTGLLVEPNLSAFQLLEGRKRKAQAVHGCLSVRRHPEKLEFDAADVFGGIEEEVDKGELENMEKRRDSIPKHMRSKYPVQCFPLYSLLLAAGLTRVDLLSLDIEGAEQKVLETLPWGKVDIGMVMIEVEHSNKTAIEQIMTEAGYRLHKSMGGQDVLYVK